MATIYTRAAKGSALTWTEGDANITNLNNAKIENVVEDLTPQLGGNLDVNGNSIVSVSNGNITLAPNGTGKVVISGDLQIDGTTTTVNSTTLDVDDINITLAKGAANAAAANGGGITVEGPTTPATITYTSANDRWNMNKTLAATLVGNVTGNADTATTLATGRTISITGDLAYTSGSFNGSGNVTGTGTLANTAVTPGSYTLTSLTVDSKGRLTAASSASTTGSGNVVLATSPSLTTPNIGTPSAGNLSNCTVDGTNAVGFRVIPSAGSDKNSSYTLATADRGEYVQVVSGGSITVPNSTFAAGDVVVIYNNHTAAITITLSTTNAYVAGVNTNRTSVTLATRGICNILFISATACVLTGNVT